MFYTRWLAIVMAIAAVGCSRANNAKADDAGNNGGDASSQNNPAPDVSADWYPCQDEFPEVAAEDCQGGPEWDRFEDPALVERGEYLVNNVAVCGDCHTPVYTGEAPGPDCPDYFDPSRDCDKHLAGFNFPYYDSSPDENGFQNDDGFGVVPFPNLTPHPDGIGQWSPEAVRLAVFRGIRPPALHSDHDHDHDHEYEIVFPFMPYYNFAHMTTEDQDAVIAYLHSVRPVPSGEPPNGPYQREPQPPGGVFAVLDEMKVVEDENGDPVGLRSTMLEFMPAITLSTDDPDYETAEKGRYLATIACTHCHTPAFPPEAGATMEEVRDNYMWIDQSKALWGHVEGAMNTNTAFPGIFWGEGFPDLIYTQNLTGHAEVGMGRWTLEEVERAVNGYDPLNKPMCPPMYVDTWYAPLKDEDVHAIAVYLRNSAPSDNDTTTDPFNCIPPGSE